MKLYFDEKLHKYTDDINRIYTSTTTVIGKYKPEFDRTYMAKACSRTKNRNSPYYGMSYTAILKLWAKDTETACANGNEKHNYLEDKVKLHSGYKPVENTVYINNRIYTINELKEGHSFGELNLEAFAETKVRYPKIYAFIKSLVEKGYRIYSELGVYDYDKIISGLIDIIFIRGSSFIILDWKTNKDDLIPLNDPEFKWKSGYYKKDQNRNSTDEFVFTNQLMYPPLNHMEASKFYIFTMQLSSYAYMVEKFGYTCGGIVLCHIRKPIEGTLERVDFHNVPFVKTDVEAMFNHHFINHTEKQLRLV